MSVVNCIADKERFKLNDCEKEAIDRLTYLDIKTIYCEQYQSCIEFSEILKYYEEHCSKR